MSAAGDRVGPYRLLEVLGEGGMGTVWRAEQVEPVRRQVALKIVKRGLDTADVVRRMHAERQALALMDHPGVARVLDAGATDDGRPYFAMELVDGRPITQACDEGGLDTDARCRLMIEVCRAVQHAHHKGVIHRDLKPGNVLVTETEAGPAPKVIDFGIAKAIEGSLAGDATLTQPGRLLGTPAYMSPEQAAGAPGDVDTRSDVWSLGVLLYELLVGELPFDPASVSTLEFPRLLAETEPRRPSARFATSETDRARIARERRADPPTLQRRLRGDLDWITMKALEKDPERRYDSPAALADDLQRHLDHLPVLASAPGTAERMAKFVRRHRVGVAAAAAVLVVAVAGVVSVIGQRDRAVEAEALARDRLRELRTAKLAAEGERDRALAAEQLAEERRGQAEVNATVLGATLEFLNDDLLGAANPARNPDREYTVREALDAAAERLGARFSGQPRVEAWIRETLGSTYAALGRYDLAEPHLMRAVELRQRALGPDDLDTWVAVADLAGLYVSLHRDEEALGLLEQAIDNVRRLGGPDHVDLGALLNSRGLVLGRMGRLDESRAAHEEAVQRLTEALGPDHPKTLSARANLAGVHRQLGDVARARELTEAVVEPLVAAVGERDPRAMNAISNLGLLLLEEGRPEEAEPQLARAVRLRTEVLGADHPDTILSLNNLAQLHVALGLTEEAEHDYRDLVAAARAAPSVPRWYLGMLVGQHGVTLRELQRYAEAEPLLLEAQAIVAEELGPDNEYASMTIQYLVNLYDRWGRPDEADAWRARFP